MGFGVTLPLHAAGALDHVALNLVIPVADVDVVSGGEEVNVETAWIVKGQVMDDGGGGSMVMIIR